MGIEQPDEPKKQLTVGEEFIEFAEKHWLLDKMVLKSTEGSESCNYDYMRDVFIQKIDSILKDRLALW